ncbi:MAG: pyruvate dehydrogenase complex dihydrolipoamide acetyltransferase [Schleiferiaceae bacterium]|nr:pyruvate dehydrogenase complex dihydrolipoamide acetyltransferase [Schleiferiaceae bacterium]
MAEIVTMPRLSDTMTEGTVAAWLKQKGDKVSEGDVLAEIETDKATMEFEAFQEGVLLYVGVAEGETAPVDSILAILGEEGEDISAILEKEKNGGATADDAEEETEKEAKETAPANEASSETSSSATEDASSETTSDRVKASPLAKKMAEDKGIDISKVKGTGEGGRIVKRDIDNFKADAPKAAPAAQQVAIPQGETVDIPVSNMRKVIAKRLAESKFTAPHFYLTREIDMDTAIAARKAINETAESKVSFNDLVIKAVALALKKHPAVNSAWLGDKIRQYGYVNIGVAVAVEDGLLVPVVRNADFKSLSTINAEVKDFAEKARSKKLQPQDWEGNTFTISNLGMFGIEEFTAIINPPDACILAVGGIVEKPVVKNGQIVVGNTMKVTLSCDHRVVDGATGAAFLQTFKNYLENPVRMLA